MSIKISQRNGLNFELDKNQFTAKTVYSPGVHDDIIIPYSIVHELQEYIVTEIGEKTFNHNTNIRSVEFPPNTEVKTIANSSFNNCSINKFTLPLKVNFIGEKAFVLCYNMKTFEIPENSELTSIGSKAFSSSPIENLSIPSKVNDLKNGWCSNLRELRSISISPNNKNYSFLDKEKKIMVGKSDKNSDLFEIIFACRDIEKAIIGPNIKRICTYAFAECENLSKIEFGENSQLEIINESAFKNCFSLRIIEFPINVETICSSAFHMCTGIQRIIFPENSKLEKIEAGCFTRSSVETVILPRKVRYIGNASFNLCRSLKAVELLSDFVEVGMRAFLKCQTLFIASFPNAQKVIVSVEAFDFCHSNFCLYTIPKATVNVGRVEK